MSPLRPSWRAEVIGLVAVAGLAAATIGAILALLCASGCSIAQQGGAVRVSFGADCTLNLSSTPIELRLDGELALEGGPHAASSTSRPFLAARRSLRRDRVHGPPGLA